MFAISVSVLKIIAIVTVTDGGQGFIQGQIRALGAQREAAFIAIGCFYIVSVPLACVFAFWLDWSIYGLWFGIGIGSLCEVILYLRLVLVTDWQKIADEAADRIER